MCLAALGKDLRLLDPVLLIDAALEAEGLAHALHVLPLPGGDLLVAADPELVELGFDAGVDEVNTLQVLRAMENLKLAMRLRLKGRPLDEAAINAIAAALDKAAETVERS